MNLTEIILKIVGIVFILVGVSLLLSLVGISFLAVSIPFGFIGGLIGGVLFLGAGIYLVRGGTISL